MQPVGHSKIALFCIAGFFLAFFLSMRVFIVERGWKHIVTSDGRGYYAYLPAIFIDNDLSFSKIVEREKKLLGYAHYKPGYLVRSDGKTLNKYFSGEALLLLPFFLLGMLFTSIFGTDMDGYSFFFQLFTGLGALFYLMLGLNFLRQIMEFFRIQSKVIVISLVIIVAGTNLFYYSLWQQTMSHVFSFFAINGFLWFAMKACREWKITTAGWMGLFLGLTCLIRPTNIVVILLIPFLSENKNQLILFFRNLWIKKRVSILFLSVILLISSVQLILWFVQTGHLMLWSYRNEGFRFAAPEIMNVLFSYRKGLFVYTPLILVSWFGLIILLFRNRTQFFSMLVFLILSTYVISSWWNWYYGDGFGLRAFIDYYGVFALLLALLLNQIKSKTGFVAVTLLLFPFIILNFLQTWQYNNLVIQPNSMNKEKYWHVFFQADSSVVNCLGGNQEMAGYSIDLKHPAGVFFNDFEKDAKYWNATSIVKTPRAYSVNHAGYLDSTHPFSPGLMIKIKQLGVLRSNYYVEGEVMVWDSIKGASNGALVVLSMDSINPAENWWQGFRLNDVPQHNTKMWRKCKFSLMLPEISNPDGILKIYLWNTKKDPLLIDDFRIRIFRSK